MRPLLLTMQAFGPYGNKVSVDFRLLGESGLYLISGDTGAGKTTIFDGICYALFDKTSGSNRTAEELRSKYAMEGVQTEVELLFLCDGKEYRIRRSPQYVYTTRNNTQSKKPAVAELTLPEGKIISKKTEVDNAVEAILHLDYEQFKRIVMIAQGDFLELLLDKQGKRGDILRRIFDTSYYKVIQDKLWSAYKDTEQQLQQSALSLRQYFNGAYYTDNTELKGKLTLLKEKEDALSADMLEVLQEIVEEDEKENRKAETRLEEQMKKLRQLQAEKAVAEKAEEDRKNLENALKELRESTEEMKRAEDEYQKALQKKPLKEQLVAEITLLKADRGKYEDAEKKKLNLKKLQENISKNEKQIKEAQIRLQKDTEELDQLRAERVTLDPVAEELIKTQNILENLSRKDAELKKLQQDHDAYQSVRKAYARLQQDYLLSAEQAENAQQAYQKANRVFLDNQAGILASTLQEGEPCPVCGAVHHPSKAHLSVATISEAELKKLHTQAEKSQKEANDLSLRAGNLKGTLEEKEKSLAETAEKEVGNADLSLLSNNITEAENALQSEKKITAAAMAALLEKQSRLKKIDQLLEDKENIIRESSGRIQKLTTEIAGDNSSFSVQNKELEALLKDLKYASRTEHEEVIQNKEEELKEINRHMESAEKKFSEKKSHSDQLKGRIESLKTSLKDVPEYDLDRIRESEKAAEEERRSLNREYMDVQKRLENNRRALQGIREVSLKSEKLEEKARWLKAMRDTATGKVIGKAKIDFETYVQMTYFDVVLSYANRRLQIMSDGQYTFKRGKSGLDLNVIDHYNGSEREVSTLSGGESFMASLSLALGLSDEVQSRTSAVHVDTMFVDEGFGSLDDETLMKAIEALGGLEEGGRLVGIISHVRDLQQRIDKQIIVRKGRNGSSSVSIEV